MTSTFFCIALAAFSADAQQLKLFEKMPDELLSYTGGARPNEKGWVGYNRNGFLSPAFQRGAMHTMLLAIVRRDEPSIDECWTAIDATFREQNEAGGFNRPGLPHGGLSGAAFWLGELDQSLLMLRESRFASKYQKRIDALLPKIRKTAEWLATSKHQAQLQKEDAQAPNRLLFDALAYGLSGVLLDDAPLKTLGRKYVDLAMTKYRESDGVFLERGGYDSSYQAVAAMKLQIWTLYFPDQKLEAAADRAVRWELGRVKPDGQIEVAGNTRTGLGQEMWMGHVKGVNVSEVTLCLLYAYARTDNSAALSAARRIVEHRKQASKAKP